MAGRAFLVPARDSVSGATPHHRRSAVVDAYYALMLECRDALFRWGCSMPRRDNVHAWVRLRFLYATDADLKRLGATLEELGQLRNQASYDQSPLVVFASANKAQVAIQDSTDTIALLDALESDSARRAAVLAALPP